MRRPIAGHHDLDREQVRHALYAASITGNRITRKTLESLGPTDLEIVANAADPVVNTAEDFDHLAAKYGEDSASSALAEAGEEWQGVIEAVCEERRARGSRRVTTTITEDQLGRWSIVHRRARPGRPLARSRARRSSPGRRRGSRRGSGTRGGSGDDSDDGGEPEPARGGHPLAGAGGEWR